MAKYNFSYLKSAFFKSNNCYHQLLWGVTAKGTCVKR